VKIAVLTPYFLPYMGGAEVGIHHIAAGLCGAGEGHLAEDEGHEVRIFVPDDSAGALYPPWQEAQNSEWEAGAPYAVTRFPDHLSRFRLSSSRKGMLSWVPPVSQRAGEVLRGDVAAFAPDAILCFYALPYARAAAAWGRRAGVPVCLSLMGGEITGPDSRLFWPLHIRAAVRRCDHTIYETPFCARTVTGGPLRRRLLLGGRPPHIIPFGVDTSLYTPDADPAAVRRQWGVGEGDPLLVTISRLARVKNIDVQIRAVARLAGSHPRLKLLVVGSGNWEPELRRLAAELGLADRVIFAGFVAHEDLPPYYRAGDLFTYSSTFETFGLVLAEAMACGTPQVAVGRTAVADVVVPDRTGLLIPDFDPDDMARAIASLLADPQRRAAMSRASADLARREYSWASVVKRYSHTLEGLAAGPR